MATFDEGAASDYARQSELDDQPFFTRMSIAVAAFIIMGFLQWALRGFVAVSAVPWWVHVHGVFMVSWLIVFATQNVLAERGAFDVHRKLGWVALFVVLGTATFGSAAGVQAIALHRVPPFFSNAYFLALTQVEIALFLLAVVWGIAVRRRTQWHRRLMLGATVLLMEPALGRLLPMPLLGAMGTWTAMAIQLVPLALLARHDRAVNSVIHPATLSSVALVIGSHVTVSALSRVPAFADWASRIAGQ